MRRLNNYIICALTSILLFFAVAGAEGITIVKFLALNPYEYQMILENNDVHSKIWSEINKHFESEENATGIPASVYMDAAMPELIKEITDENLRSAFDFIEGKSDNLDFSSSEKKLEGLKNSVDSFFDDYAASVNYKKDEAYYSKTESVYKNAVSYITDTADVYQFSKINKAGYLSAARKVYGYTKVLLIAAYGVTAVLIAVIIAANFRNISASLYWISISLGSVSSVLAAVGLYFRNSGYFNRFAVKAPHIFSAVTGVCFEFTDVVIFTNAAMFAAGVVLMIIYIFTGKKKVKE